MTTNQTDQTDQTAEQISEQIAYVGDMLESSLMSDDAYQREPRDPVNVVDGLFAIARAIESLAGATWALGNGNAATQFGAIEALSMQMKDGLDGIAGAISTLDADRE